MSTTPPGTLIALYHALGEPGLRGYRDALPLADFVAQIDWLQRRYRILPLSELLARHRAGQTTEGLAALTFDDGDRSLGPALALLRDRDLPATLFPVGDLLDGRPFWRDRVTQTVAEGRVEAFLRAAAADGLDVSRLRATAFYRDSKDPARVDVAALAERLLGWPAAAADRRFLGETALRDLAWPGLSLGNHSYRHLPLAALTAAEQRDEIGHMQARLQSLGLPLCPVLAVPFGGVGTWNAASCAAAAACGLQGLALTAPGLPAALPGADDDFPLLYRALLGRWRCDGDRLMAPAGRDRQGGKAP